MINVENTNITNNIIVSESVSNHITFSVNCLLIPKIK